jgi:nitrogen-specific signal transduction histidine kinase
MAQQCVQVAQRGAVADLVEVVDDEHDRLVPLLERVDEGREHELGVVVRLHHERVDRLAEVGAP